MDAVFHWLHFNCFILGVYAIKVVCAYVCFIFYVASTGNILGEILKVVTWLTLLVFDLVGYLCEMVLSTLISFFGVFLTSGIKWGCVYGVSAFMPQLSFLANFPLSWCNCLIFAWLKIFIFFYRCTCWSSYGCSPKIDTLGCSSLVNCSFDCYEFLIWVYSWFTCWRFSWYASMTSTLGGTSEEVVFPHIFARDINAYVCELTSVTSGLAGSGFYSA